MAPGKKQATLSKRPTPDGAVELSVRRSKKHRPESTQDSFSAGKNSEYDVQEDAIAAVPANTTMKNTVVSSQEELSGRSPRPHSEIESGLRRRSRTQAGATTEKQATPGDASLPQSPHHRQRATGANRRNSTASLSSHERIPFNKSGRGHPHGQQEPLDVNSHLKALQKSIADADRRVINSCKEISTTKKAVDDLTDTVNGLKDGVKTLVTMLKTQSEPGTEMKGRKKSMFRPDTSAMSKKPKDVYDQILRRRVQHVELVFNHEMISRSLFNSFVHHTLAECDEQGLSVNRLYKLFAGFLFTIGSKDKKEVMGDKLGPGPMSSSIRLRAMRVALYFGRMNSFHVFRTKSQEAPSGGINGGRSLLPEQPFWLGRDGKDSRSLYFSNKLVETAVKRHEEVSKDNTAYQRRMQVIKGAVLLKSEEANYAIDIAYSVLLVQLREGRRMAGLEFNYNLGYLFTNWNAFKSVRISQSNLSMEWESRMCPAVLMDEVPNMLTQASKEEQKYSKNEASFEEFLEKRTELNLIVEHDVYVNLSGHDNPQRFHKGSQVRTWKRSINLLEVSCAIVKAMCGFPRDVDIIEMMAFHKHSLDAMYNIAHALRVVLQREGKGKVRSMEYGDDYGGEDRPHSPSDNGSGAREGSDDGSVGDQGNDNGEEAEMNGTIDRNENAEPTHSEMAKKGDYAQAFMELLSLKPKELGEVVERAVQRVPEATYRSSLIDDTPSKNNSAHPLSEVMCEDDIGDFGI